MSSDPKPKTPKPKIPKSKYEHVMLAAKEARRLNEKYTNRGLTPLKKVTSEAIQRVEDGEVDYEYDAEQRQAKVDDEETEPRWAQ